MTNRLLLSPQPLVTFFANLSLIAIIASVGVFATSSPAQDFSSLFEEIDPSVVTIHTQELVSSAGGAKQQGGAARVSSLMQKA